MHRLRKHCINICFATKKTFVFLLKEDIRIPTQLLASNLVPTYVVINNVTIMF